MENIFKADVSENIIRRIEKLNPDTKPNWGKMSVSQMLAHCNVTYELVYDNKHPKPNFLVELILKTFVKKYVVSEQLYKKNNGTAPYFVIKEEKNFASEQQRLIGFIRKTQQLGEQHFNGLKSHSFGALNANEWNNMFYKHLDHHLTQFGV